MFRPANVGGGEGGSRFCSELSSEISRLANCWKFHRFNDGQKGGSGRAKDSKAKRVHFSNRSSLLHRCEGWSMVFGAKYDRINLCNRIDRSTNGVQKGWVYSASLRIFHGILFHFSRKETTFFFFLLFLSSSRKFERFLEMFRERNNKFYFCLLWISNGSKEEYRENVFEEIIKFMILFTNEKKKKEKRKYERRRRTGDFQIFYYIWRNITFSVFKKKKKKKILNTNLGRMNKMYS